MSSRVLGQLRRGHIPPRRLDIEGSALVFANWRRLYGRGPGSRHRRPVVQGSERQERPEQDLELDRLWDEHYSRDVRVALPVMAAESVEPLISLLEETGFGDVEVCNLPLIERAEQNDRWERHDALVAVRH
jgi:hypothetical protein